jgi:hypothetical protein
MQQEEQFGSVFEQYPPALEQVPAAQQWLTTTDLQEAPPAGLRGTVAKLVLDAFEFTGRFVDDFTSGPNRFLDKLWYDCDSILGDLIKGIYPGGEDGLTLECVPGAPHAYPTLDVCITTDADEYGRAQSLSCTTSVGSHATRAYPWFTTCMFPAGSLQGWVLTS